MIQSWSRFSFLDTAVAYILDASNAAAFIATASGAAVSGAAMSDAAVPDAAVSGFRLSAVPFLLTWVKACWASWAFQSFHDQRGMLMLVVLVVCGHRLSVESIVASNPLAFFTVAIVATVV